MTQVLFDAETGRLRLPPERFDALLAWAQGEHADEDGMRELRDAGVLRRDRPHPNVAPSVAALAQPVCMVSLYVTAVNAGSDVHGFCWMGEESAGLLLDAPEDLLELVGLEPMFVPAALARVLDISPRSITEEAPLRVPSMLVNEVFTGERARDFLARSASAEISELLTAEGTRYWELAVRWPDSEPSPIRVIDTATGFRLVVEDEPGYAVLTPVSSTEVWRVVLRQFA